MTMLETQQARTTMPFSQEAEENVLGSILINAEVLKDINLQPEDFYIERNRWVFSAMLDLRRSGQDIDEFTTAAALDKLGKLAEVGGAARLMALSTNCITSMHAESYANIIREKAKCRRILKVANDLAKAAVADKGDLDSTVSASMDALAKSIVSTRGAVHATQFISQVYDEVDEAYKNPRDIYGIPTGLTDWDKITCGLQKGEVVRLSGEPGLGKSLLLMQILTNVAKSGHPVALYELEMSGRQVIRRQLSANSKIGTAALRSGRIHPDQWTQFVAAIEAMSNLPIYISDSSQLSTADLRVDLQRLIEYHGVEVVGLDYEALLSDPGPTENERRSLISDRVHAICKDLDVAMISVGDMTKAGIRGETRGQGSMAGTAHELHNADSIVIMRRVENNPNLINLTWEKLREGDGDRSMQLLKLPGIPAFGPVAPEAPAQKTYQRQRPKLSHSLIDDDGGDMEF